MYGFDDDRRCLGSVSHKPTLCFQMTRVEIDGCSFQCCPLYKDVSWIDWKQENLAEWNADHDSSDYQKGAKGVQRNSRIKILGWRAKRTKGIVMAMWFWLPRVGVVVRLSNFVVFRKKREIFNIGCGNEDSVLWLWKFVFVSIEPIWHKGP